MRVLVTGVAGFVGRYLIPRLMEKNPEVELVGQARTRGGTSGLPLLNCAFLDLLDQNAVQEMCHSMTPDTVIHLAAQSSGAAAFKNPRETWETNLWGTFNLLEALREQGFTGRLLFVGSGEVYATAGDRDLPLRESFRICPRNPYAASKAAAELLCYQYSIQHDMEVVLVRAFNHIGPGQSTRFVVANFSRQIAQIELGLKEPVLFVGSLDVIRDFLDVRDVVDAYIALLAHGNTGEAYNVCSGQGIVLREILDTLINFSSQSIEVRVDRSRLRPSDTPRLWGSHDKITQDTGWSPRRATKETLYDIFQYWMEELQK